MCCVVPCGYHIYISRLYKILVIFVVINEYQCVAHCGPSIDRQFYIPLLLCNELGEVNAGCIPARPASVDQVHTKK